MGIPWLGVRTAGEEYEQQLKAALSRLVDEGMEGGVFGDIDIEEHREWVERVCADVGMAALLPLWGEPQDKVMQEIFSSGFEAMVVAVRANVLPGEWLGRPIDMEFVRDLHRLNAEGGSVGVQPCGEAGEYHSFVIDGPGFRKRIEAVKGRTTLVDGVHALDIRLHRLLAK